MKLPDDFAHGYFKLESCFFIYHSNNNFLRCTIILNNYSMLTDFKFESTDVRNYSEAISAGVKPGFAKGTFERNFLFDGKEIYVTFDNKEYTLKIVNETWVDMNRR